jgi:hypothetical protein
MTATPLEAIDGGCAPDGWERLWASDRWSLRELPDGDLHSTVRTESVLFSGIPQPWLKEAAKRWTRARPLRGAAQRRCTTMVAASRDELGTTFLPTRLKPDRS